MKKLLWIPLVVASLFIVPVYANQKDDMDSDTMNSKNCMCHEKLDKMINSFHMTQDQKNKIRSIRNNAKSSLSENRAKLKDIRMQMRDAITSDSMDESKIDSLIQQKMDILKSMMKTKAMMEHNLYNTLDAKQKEKFKAMLGR